MVMKNRLTEKQISEMKQLQKEGLSYPEISIKLKIKYHSVIYHLNDNYRKKTIERVKKNRKKSDGEKNKKYHRDYQKDRYANDSEFRKKQQERSREYKKKKTQEKKK